MIASYAETTKAGANVKKILFLIQSYPSRQSANVLCDEKIINAMKDTDNYEISCLSFRYYNDLAFEERDNVRVHRFYKSLFWRAYIWSRENTDSILAKAISKADRILLRIKQFFFIPIYPCIEPLAAHRYSQKAISLCKSEHFDMIVSEYHGYETLYAGYRVKKRFPQVVFLPIFWDSLSGGFPAKYLPQKYERKRRRACEEKLVANAERIIVMEASKKFHEQYSSNMIYYHKMVYMDIPGFIKQIYTEQTSSLIMPGKINIVFSGVLTLPDRDPTYILQLFDCLNRKDVVLVFLCIGNGKRVLERENLDFKGKMIVSGYVKQNELKAIYRDANFLINFGSSNPSMVPSKIFEYMSHGKPIISTKMIDDEPCIQYLKHYPAALIIDQRVPLHENAEKLNVFINKNVGLHVPYGTIRDSYRKNTPEAYVDIFKALLKNENDQLSQYEYI